MAEVDAEFGIAPREPLQTEIHAFDGSLAQRQAEISLPGLVGVADAVDDLLDVHLPLGGLAQVELRPADLAAAEHHSAAENAQPRDVSVCLRHDAHGFLYHVILHGGDIEQQREHHGQNYQQQNRYREHLSQYFYTFAH